MTEHKAFLFDFDRFNSELRPLLVAALESGDLTGLVSFIGANLSELKDPYEGEPLTADWQKLIETRDAHQLGDFALTKYYDPQDDRGLGSEWQAVQDIIAKNLKESPILGTAVGPKGNLFDPGKMGSYFQSSAQVRSNIAKLAALSSSNGKSMTRAMAMLEAAEEAGTGLYVTF